LRATGGRAAGTRAEAISGLYDLAIAMTTIGARRQPQLSLKSRTYSGPTSPTSHCSRSHEEFTSTVLGIERKHTGSCAFRSKKGLGVRWPGPGRVRPFGLPCESILCIHAQIVADEASCRPWPFQCRWEGDPGSALTFLTGGPPSFTSDWTRWP